MNLCPFFFTTQGEIQGLLCVDYDNSAVIGEYFNHGELTTRSIDRQMKTTDFNFWQNDVIPYNSNEVEGTYLIGDHIPTIIRSYSTDALSKYTLESSLSLPAPGDGRFCNSNNAIRFGIDSNVSCWIAIDELEKNCKRSLDVDKFLTNIRGEFNSSLWQISNS